VALVVEIVSEDSFLPLPVALVVEIVSEDSFLPLSMAFVGWYSAPSLE